jgi:hypothetical protein
MLHSASGRYDLGDEKLYWPINSSQLIASCIVV